MGALTFVKLYHDILRRKDVSSGAKLVFSAMLDRARNSGTAWPGYRTIAADVGMNKDSVGRAINELVNCGLLTRLNKKNGRFIYSFPEWNDLENDGPKCPRNWDTSGGDDCPSFSDSAVPVSRTGVSEVLGRNCPSFSDISRKTNETEQLKQNKGARKAKPKATRDPWSEARAAMCENSPLMTEAFEKSWGDWCAYRSEKRKPLGSRAVALQIRKLEGYGHDGAIESIYQSIANDWQGIFEPRGAEGFGRSHRPHPLGASRLDAPKGKYSGIGIVCGGTSSQKPGGDHPFEREADAGGNRE